MVQCVQQGHEIVALANLKPKDNKGKERTYTRQRPRGQQQQQQQQQQHNWQLPTTQRNWQRCMDIHHVWYLPKAQIIVKEILTLNIKQRDEVIR